jgi:mono/diheme cytochrome c family protein
MAHEFDQSFLRALTGQGAHFRARRSHSRAAFSGMNSAEMPDRDRLSVIRWMGTHSYADKTPGSHGCAKWDTLRTLGGLPMRAGTAWMCAAALLASGCEGEGRQSSSNSALVLQFEGAGADTAAARLAHGQRLARVLGCHSCHGDNLQGTNATAEDPDFGDMNAPNVTLMLASYSDAQLERLIRRGEPRDGRPFWFMASESFQFLGDSDLSDLVAYLRTFRPAGRPMRALRFGPGFRRAQATGEIAPAQRLVVRFRTEGPVQLGPQHAYGRWLARLVCAECHNASLQGYDGFTPDLDIAGLYSAAELDRLLTTGQGKTDRDLGMMRQTARARLLLLRPAERAAIIGYIRARAAHDMGE